jgi:hypothetical protein
MTSSVSSFHPSITAIRRNEWRLCRDAIDGEGAIKARGEQYLIEPTGYSTLETAPRKAAYQSYISRAMFPNWMAASVGAMIGIIHGREINITMPDAMMYLWENADGDGLPLEAFHRRITREMLVIGSYAVLTDAPRDGGDPYLAGYRRDRVINWDKDWWVLDETRIRRDGFAWEQLERYLVLGFGEAGYTPLLLDEAGDVIEQIEVRARGGGMLPRIPFVIGNALDLSPRIEAPPLIGIARASLDYYQLSADQRIALYMSANPTLLAVNGDAPQVVGAGVVHEMRGAPGMEPDLRYVEADNGGISERRTEMMGAQQQAVMAGARLFEQTAAGQESGEAKRLRYASETATLVSVAQNSCLLLERALKNAAMIMGLSEDDIVVEAPSDLMDRTLSPTDFAALFGVYERGGMSWETYFRNGQRGGVFSPEDTAEDEAGRLDAPLSTDDAV